MKKIIPFCKDIEFNTDIYEINSISLEHNLKFENNDINGEFIISGDYKESDNVINNEPFIYNIPFDINLDYRYSSDKVQIEIDDFNYEIIDKNVLRVNIKVSIDGIELIEVLEETPVQEPIIEKEEIEEDEVRSINTEEVASIFNNFTESDEKYVTYHVHIFRENDSIDSILKLYNVSKEELDEYNDLTNVLVGSKLIIPCNELL